MLPLFIKSCLFRFLIYCIDITWQRFNYAILCPYFKICIVLPEIAGEFSV